MKRFLLMGSFILGNLAILVSLMIFLTIYTTRNTSAAVTTDLPLQSDNIDQASGTAIILPPQNEGQLVVTDARPVIIDNFYQEYHSPMQGLGKDLVASADRHNLPFNIVTAIGQCEGSSGKVIPLDSHNTWGYGIYSGKVKRFASWQEAIEAVSNDLSVNYFQKGMDTPETIMPRYTPNSNGSWANCVNQFLQELQ